METKKEQTRVFAPFQKFRKSCLTCGQGTIIDTEKETVNCPFSVEIIQDPDEDAKYCGLYWPKE